MGFAQQLKANTFVVFCEPKSYINSMQNAQVGNTVRIRVNVGTENERFVIGEVERIVDCGSPQTGRLLYVRTSRSNVSGTLFDGWECNAVKQ